MDLLDFFEIKKYFQVNRTINIISQKLKACSRVIVWMLALPDDPSSEAIFSIQSFVAYVYSELR